MEIRKKFNELIPIMEDAYKAEKLISKKIFSISSRLKVSDINITNDKISCAYNIDSKYKIKLNFTRNSEDYIEFKTTLPSLFYIIIFGAFLGLRFNNELGLLLGVILGVCIFWGISILVNNYFQRVMWDRINERWNSVI